VVITAHRVQVALNLRWHFNGAGTEMTPISEAYNLLLILDTKPLACKKRGEETLSTEAKVQ
jgi:hypothetical protein